MNIRESRLCDRQTLTAATVALLFAVCSAVFVSRRDDRATTDARAHRYLAEARGQASYKCLGLAKESAASKRSPGDVIAISALSRTTGSFTYRIGTVVERRTTGGVALDRFTCLVWQKGSHVWHLVDLGLPALDGGDAWRHRLARDLTLGEK